MELQKGKLYRLKVPRKEDWTETSLPKGSIFVLLGFEKRNGIQVPYYLIHSLFGDLKGSFRSYRELEAVLELVEEPE